jgi:glycosyltransferase involved in cell wall biosynthesis
MIRSSTIINTSKTVAQFPKISIVTPCYNSVAYLEKAIESLISQGYPNLEYILIDGGSTDGTLGVIKKYESHFSYWVSEPDKGMYDALRKGFEVSTGEIMGWLNSDDIHHPGSLFTLAQVFKDFEQVNWIQGTPNIIDEEGRIVYAAPRPEVDRFFFYQKKHIKTGSYIQQESTFWRRSLWEKSGGFISGDYKYAGDFELWIRFFQYEKLFLLPALTGGFRLSATGQLSTTHLKEYCSETQRILEQHPLPNGLRRRLWIIQMFEGISNRLNFAARLARRFRSKNMSVVKGKIRFDRLTQKFKSAR